MAPWCCVMPQSDVITVDNWVPAAKSKPMVKLADSATRFTPEETQSPSAFTVAERNVCALTSSEDSSDGSSRDGSQGPGGSSQTSSAVLILGSKSSDCRRSATTELDTA